MSHLLRPLQIWTCGVGAVFLCKALAPQKHGFQEKETDSEVV